MQTIQKWIEGVDKNIDILKREYEKAATLELQRESKAIPMYDNITRVRKELYEHWCGHKTHLINLKENSWQFTPEATRDSLSAIIREARIQASTCSKDVVEDEMRTLAIIKQEKALVEEQRRKEEEEKEEKEKERRRKEEEEIEAKEREKKVR